MTHPTTLRGGFSTEDPRLDRLPPTDWQHYEKYPMPRQMAAAITAPVVLGINWYSNFDKPVLKGRYHWIGIGDLGRVRGGHAICTRPYAWIDYADWWDYYDQGSEGACVGFAWSRCMTLLNRRRYGARTLYHEAQRIDPWQGGAYPGASPFYEGTDTRAGASVLVNRGHCRIYRNAELPWESKEGIAVYRWAATWDEVRTCLSIPDSVDGVPLLNSWGRDYPHVVKITDEAGARVLQEDGEAGIPTDR